MSEKKIPYKIYLEENEMPTQWYNVRADMKNKPAPLLNPATLKPMTAEELGHVFCDELVKQELAEYELIPEDWGGSTIFVPVSAHTKEGIQELLEMILLTAEVIAAAHDNIWLKSHSLKLFYGMLSGLCFQLTGSAQIWD